MTELEYGKLIQDWQQVKKLVDEYSAVEKDLKEKILKMTFQDIDKGTQTYKLGAMFGIKGALKATYSQKLTLGKNVEVEAVMEKLNPIVANRLFSYKYAISKKEYDELTYEEKMLVSKAVTLKNEKPTIKYVETEE